MKTSSDSDSSLTREASQGGNEPSPGLTRGDSKLEKEKSEIKGDAKSKPRSPEKKKKGKMEESKIRAGKPEKGQENVVVVEADGAKTRVMIDVGIQSEPEELSDMEAKSKLLTRKSSILEVVPEEKEHDEVQEEQTELVRILGLYCVVT